MAAENFKFSRSLFVSKNGHSVSFYMRPCSERKRLKPVIEHGGGNVSNRQTRNCIKLLEPGGSVTSDGYIKSEFVWCCVRENKFVDMTKFRCVPGRVSPSDDDGLSPARNIIRTQRQRKGRQKYTREDDRRIVGFLVREHRYNEVHGRKVWQDMELFEVSKHPFESMRSRYLKFILPNIKTYTDFPEHWAALLTGNTADASQADRSEPNTSPVSGPVKSSQVSSPRSSVQVSSTRKSIPMNSPPKANLETDDNAELSQSILKEGTARTIYSSPAKESKIGQSETIPRSSSTAKAKTLSKTSTSVQSRSPYFSLNVNKNTKTHSDSSEVDEFDKNLLQTAMDTDCVDPGNSDLEVFHKQSIQPKTHEENTAHTGNRKRTGSAGKTSETDSTDDEVSFRHSHNLASRTPRNTDPDFKKMCYNNSRWRLEDCDTESQPSQERDHGAADQLQTVEETSLQLKRIGKRFGLTLQEVLYSLYINSGSEEDALHWIRFGVDTEGYPAWSQKDDEILLGTDEDSMAALELKHGPKRLISRRAFIEGM